LTSQPEELGNLKKLKKLLLTGNSIANIDEIKVFYHLNVKLNYELSSILWSDVIDTDHVV